MAIGDTLARVDRALELSRRLDAALARVDAAMEAHRAGPTAGTLAELGEARALVRRIGEEARAAARRAGGDR